MKSAAALTGGRAEIRGMWFGISEGALAPTVMRPVQFHDIWSRSGSVTPERGLALAVVQSALNDLVSFRFAKRRRGQRLYWQAYAWVAADDREWPFSFVNLCESLGLSVEPLRQWAFAPMRPARASAERRDADREPLLGKAA